MNKSNQSDFGCLKLAVRNVALLLFIGVGKFIYWCLACLLAYPWRLARKPEEDGFDRFVYLWLLDAALVLTLLVLVISPRGGDVVTVRDGVILGYYLLFRIGQYATSHQYYKMKGELE